MKNRNVNTLPENAHPPFTSLSERNLAAAILRQAWSEAVIDLFVIKETVRENHSLLKKDAVNWINGAGDGFVYWCQLAEVDHLKVRERLNEILHSQAYSS